MLLLLCGQKCRCMRMETYDGGVAAASRDRGRKEGRFSMTQNRSKSENKLRPQEAAGERMLHRSEPRDQTKHRIIHASMEKTMDRNPSNQDRKCSDKSEGWHQINVK